MIDKFKAWLSRKDNSMKKSKIESPIHVENIEDFKKESEDILSYLLDDGSISIKVENDDNQYKVEIIVNQIEHDDEFLQELDRSINGYKTVSFENVKEDITQYFNYINKKYIINAHFRIENDDNFTYKIYKISEIDEVPKYLNFNRIVFYIKKA